MNKFLSWFKPKNKRNVVLPIVDSKKQLHGMDLIKAFTTEDEPKVVEYPKKFYKLYWETFVEPIPGGYGALVRFYSVDEAKVVKAMTFTQPSVTELKEEVNREVRAMMAANKR